MDSKKKKKNLFTFEKLAENRKNIFFFYLTWLHYYNILLLFSFFQPPPTLRYSYYHPSIIFFFFSFNQLPYSFTLHKLNNTIQISSNTYKTLLHFQITKPFFHMHIPLFSSSKPHTNCKYDISTTFQTPSNNHLWHHPPNHAFHHHKPNNNWNTIKWILIANTPVTSRHKSQIIRWNSSPHYVHVKPIATSQNPFLIYFYFCLHFMFIYSFWKFYNIPHHLFPYLYIIYVFD